MAVPGQLNRVANRDASGPRRVPFNGWSGPIDPKLWHRCNAGARNDAIHRDHERVIEPSIP